MRVQSYLSFACGIVALCMIHIRAQNLRRGRKPRPGRSGVPRDVETTESGGQLFNSLSIHYPLAIFDPVKPNDWRTPGTYSESLAQISTAEKHYVDLARAQDQEDVWLYENWFYGIESGIIMESGALDGILFSTSFMFETFANWTAIHVEADPLNYDRLKRNRVNAINVNGALCSEPKLLHYSSLGVIPVRGFIEFMSPSFIKKWHGKIYNNKTSIDELPTVQCLPMKRLLQELNVKHVDIWILDVEGAEESVLRGTDFSTVRFNAVAMECDEHDITKNERKTNILEANGFKCELVERNCMCKNLLYTSSKAPARTELKKWDGQKWAGTYNKEAQV
jgi:FkbM family methyltransferase